MKNLFQAIGRTFWKVDKFLWDLAGYEVWPRKKKKQEEPLCCQNELSRRNNALTGSSDNE